jgi:HprK-related kinase A
VRVGELDAAAFAVRVARGEATIGIGPFRLALQSGIAALTSLIHHLYADYPLVDTADFVDYRIGISRPKGPRRWIRPYAEFATAGEHPFAPMPIENAFPLLEWGFNWCVATTAHQYLMLHAGVVERDGVTLLMPALPGSGKSTLCAALAYRGWRLLSDEFALVRPGGIDVTPFPRCTPLKNESIPVIRAFAPDAVLGPTFLGTRKGDVAHVRPPRDSVERAGRTAAITHVLFPHYGAGSPVTFTPIPKARAFIKVASNSFNYEVFGVDGFRTVGDIIERSECIGLGFGDLQEAIAALDALKA